MWVACSPQGQWFLLRNQERQAVILPSLYLMCVIYMFRLSKKAYTSVSYDLTQALC